MPTDTPTQLTRRRLLAGITAVGAASAVGGAGTVALLSDTESSTGNTIQAGTIDLVVDESDGATTVFSPQELAPGDTGTAVAPIENQGSIDGELSVTIDTVTHSGGETVDSEGQPDSDDGSALLDELSLEIGFDEDYGTDSDLSDGDEEVAVDGYLSNSDYTGGTTHDTTFALSAGATGPQRLYVHWALDSDAPNTVQGDEVSVEFTVNLEQQP